MKSKLKRKITSEICGEILFRKTRKRKVTMENQRSDLDQQSEAETHNTKISDSGYSTGCSNSQSQRSGSSKSMHSNSGSSNSSGYGGLPTTVEEFPQPHSSKSSSKNKDHKKKKSKSQEAIGGGECKTSDETKDKTSNESTDLAGRNQTAAVPVSMANINNNNSVVNCAAKTGTNNLKSGKNGNNLNSTNHAGNVNNREALHLATVAQTLKCIKKMRSSDGDIETNLESIELDETKETPESLFNKLKREPFGSVSGQFCLAVSMHDGKVLYTTSTLTDVLGFPCDMWIGRSFIDFVHQKDRIAFANHITVGVAGPMISNSLPAFGKTCKTSNNTFFCCLRKYRGLKTSGFGVKDKAVEYVPFKLSLSFKEVRGEITDTLLVITATTVKTAYNRPDEMRDAPKFATRHLANTHLSHVDVEAVSYLGYLPQDMIGRSIFDFYHPEDLPLLKEIYESVIEIQGSTYRSKPYRFRTQNGGFVLLETEWSSFINPWSKKLEFTIGQHRLLRGPPNPDVFAPPMEHQQTPDEVLKENQHIQEEIKRILSEPVSRSSEFAKQQVSKRCKDLATFMESLMEKITKSEHGNFGEVPVEEDSFSERDSVMLGEISPHHDYCDSKSSSETPPSYNQLNYNENLQRFFDSRPRTLTASDENSDLKVHSLLEEEGKTSPGAANNGSPVNGSGTCSGSGSGLSSASNCIIGTNSTETSTSKHQDNYEPVTVLTEAVLCRHNEDMEKVLIKRHRDLRVKDDKINEIRLKTVIEKLQDHCHGIKRSGSLSWEGNKVSKYRHTEPNTQNLCKKNSNAINTIKRTEISLKADIADSDNPQIYQQGPNNVDLWPPFSATTFNQSVPPHATYTTSNRGMPVAGMIPVYYITTGGNHSMTASQNAVNISGNEIAPNEHPGPPSPLLMGGNAFVHQDKLIQFMNAFPVYPAMGFGTPSLMYSPLMMAPQAPPRHQAQAQTQPMKIKSENEKGPAKFQRPASQATSVKAEPGSAMGSMVLSECSKKEEKSIGSPEVEDSLCFSQNDEQPKKMSEMPRDTGTGTGDESSYSSYSSFLKTDDSMRSSEDAEPGFLRKEGQWDEIKKDSDDTRPVRKEPPWMEKVNLTPELVFRYQLNSREVANVLESDLEVLKATDQPKLVDEQLQQLYIDLEVEGMSTKLKFEEGLTTSSSSGEEQPGASLQKQSRRKKKQPDTTQFVMMYDENMPLPSPTRTPVISN